MKPKTKALTFKATRTVVTYGTETTQGIWDFLKANPLSHAEAQIPYIGKVRFEWREKESYYGCRPEWMYTPRQHETDKDKIELRDLVRVTGQSLHLFCVSPQEMERLLLGAQKHLKWGA